MNDDATLGRGACHLDCSLCIRLLTGNGEIIAQVRGSFPGGCKGQDVIRVRACFGKLVFEMLIHSYCRVIVWVLPCLHIGRSMAPVDKA